MKKKSSFFKKLSSSGFTALLTMFAWELVEEGVESLIAYTISSAFAIFITKAISTLAIVTTTQGIKITIKRFLVPFFKNIINKMEITKMSKIKEFFAWIFANKKTLIGTIVGGTGTGLGITASWTLDSLPQVMVKGFNIAPIIYTIVCLIAFALNEIGVCGKGFESVQVFLARCESESAIREEKALIKEAQREIDNEKKLATQSIEKQEKEKARAEAEQKAKEEKAKAEAEHRAKIEEIKAKLRNAN